MTEMLLRKPTKFGNSLYLLVSDLLVEGKYYKVSVADDGKITIEKAIIG